MHSLICVWEGCQLQNGIAEPGFLSASSQLRQPRIPALGSGAVQETDKIQSLFIYQGCTALPKGITVVGLLQPFPGSMFHIAQVLMNMAKSLMGAGGGYPLAPKVPLEMLPQQRVQPPWASPALWAAQPICPHEDCWVCTSWALFHSHDSFWLVSRFLLTKKTIPKSSGALFEEPTELQTTSKKTQMTHSGKNASPPVSALQSQLFAMASCKLMFTEETASPAFSPPATPTAELTLPPGLISTGELARET